MGHKFTLPLGELGDKGIKVFFASVIEEDGEYITTSSRSVALLKVSETPRDAREAIEGFLRDHCPPGLYYRRDIPRIL